MKLTTNRVVFAFFAFISAAVACTVPPYVGTGISGWPPCQVVTVNVDPSFSDSQYDKIVGAFHQWQNSINLANGTIILFDGFTRSSTALAGPNFHSGINVYQVTRAQPIVPGDSAETGPIQTGPVRGWAWTFVNPLVTDDTFLAQAMAHEIGHTFGLGDCVFCEAKSSIMITGVDMNDTSVLPDGPTTCRSCRGCQWLLSGYLRATILRSDTGHV